MLTLAGRLRIALGVALTTQLKAIYCPLFVEHGTRAAFGGTGDNIATLSPFILLSLILFISLLFFFFFRQNETVLELVSLLPQPPEN